ncbi:ATP-binding protein [Clostridium sp. OF10-22XD]|nr:ATP-binding protein [Clostridium sp. OF10-22XD]
MKKISFMEISSGEYVGVCSIEITSIPDISIISSGYQDHTDIEKEYMNNFSSLASEVFQNYKYIISQNSNAEISMELLWVTEPVNNQPYKAKIRPFLVIRAISGDQSSAQAIIEQIYSLYESSLKLQKYGFEEIEFTRLTEIISGVQIEDGIAIVKDEREENLNTQFLSAVYSIDVFDSYAHDMSSIMNELTEQPYSMLSIQLFPTQLTVEEKTEIARIAQILDTLNKGVMTQGVGNVSISAAGRLAEIYKYYQTVSAGAMFGYNIIVAGSYGNTDKLASKVQGYISYDSENPVFMKQVHMDTSQLRITDNYYSFPWIVNELLIDLNRNPYIWNQDNSDQFLYRMPYVISAKEAGGIFRLPLGNGRISAGLPINDSESASKTYADNLINAGDIEIGILKKSEKNTIGISLKDLAKHMLVVGTPGSGKTTFSVSLLDRLWKEHNIPFLVIEPAKNEYRALIQSIPEIQIFTPGKNFISPFVFNPFVPPENVRLETYKSTLKTAFAAAVSMTTPLDKIFEEAINNCYSDFRWLDNYTMSDKGQIFNITDFIKCFKNTFDEIGYTGDAKNIGRAGVVRLKSLENLFDNYFSIPIQDLLQKPTIIELAAIENSDQKALIISLLLLSILAYVNANYVGDGGLKNVILLEEAHVLLDASSNVGQGDANPSAIAQNLVKRMLAEIRSYGVGIIIADQSPRKVSTDVVALTDMKMVFRLVEATDKQIIADSMNMGDGQEQRLSRLKPGEAFLFFNKLDSPEEVVTPDYRLENNIDITLSDKDIGKLTTYWNDKKKNLRPYPECDEVFCCKECCIYERRILAKEIARRIFVKNFKSDMSDFNAIKKVFAQITKLTKYELNDEEFSPELLACVKVQLWRKIVYGTNISVNEKIIHNSLRKS